MDEQSGESKEEEVMSEGIGESEMEGMTCLDYGGQRSKIEVIAGLCRWQRRHPRHLLVGTWPSWHSG